MTRDRPRALVALGAALVVLGALGACATDVPRATPLDAERAARTRPGTTLADLERGRTAYLSKCTSCHRPIAPRSIAGDRWPQHVDEMRERAHLSAEEHDAIVLYLTTIAAAPPPPSAHDRAGPEEPQAKAVRGHR
jgi:cytochrome c5